MDFDKIKGKEVKLKMRKGKVDLRKIERALSKKVKSKQIVKKSQLVVDIKEKEQEDFAPIFFKMEVEDAKKKLFFK